jgi:hypothetical protein
MESSWKSDDGKVWRRYVVGKYFAWLGVYPARTIAGNEMVGVYEAAFCVSDRPEGRKSIGGTYTSVDLAKQVLDEWWAKGGSIEAAPKSDETERDRIAGFEITYTIPDGMSDDRAIEYINKHLGAMNDLNRALGGSGIKLIGPVRVTNLEEREA